jgi:hypothetical protein
MTDSIPHGRITVSVADGVASVVMDNPCAGYFHHPTTN